MVHYTDSTPLLPRAGHHVNLPKEPPLFVPLSRYRPNIRLDRGALLFMTVQVVSLSDFSEGIFTKHMTIALGISLVRLIFCSYIKTR